MGHFLGGNRQGEILECDDLSGRPLSEVLEKIRRRGIKDVRVFIADAGGELPVSELAQHQSATVVRVESNEKNGLMVLAADDLNSLPPQPTVPASSRCG